MTRDERNVPCLQGDWSPPPDNKLTCRKAKRGVKYEHYAVGIVETDKAVCIKPELTWRVASIEQMVGS